MRNKKGEKVPEEWVICPKCSKYYGWVNCRVTMQNPRRERCLRCAVEEEELAKKHVV